MSINFSISVDQGWWMKLRKINDVLAKQDSTYLMKTHLRFEIWYSLSSASENIENIR